MNITPEQQLSDFRDAVQLLGGERSAARAIGIGERTIYRLLSGESPLHSGFLRDIATALIAHADRCRALERRLSPAFAANLTARQITATPDRRRHAGKGN